MNVSDYKTRTIIEQRSNPSVDGKFLIGIDVGYSGCKVFSQNKVACFPCYAKKIEGEIVSTAHDEFDIWYRDNVTGEKWAIGETAIAMMGSQDTNDNVTSMYSRSRYSDPMFIVLLRTGVGLGMMKNSFGSAHGKELWIETGLPAAYMADEYMLKDSFCQDHDFAVRVGSAPWENFKFTLDPSHVYVTSQPKGTLYSSIVSSSGEFIESGNKVLKSRTLIFDAGFNTLDLVRNLNGVIDSNTVSYNNLGMKQIFVNSASKFFERYREKIEIPYMQKVLSTGIINVYDRKTHTTSEVDVSDIIESETYAVCMQALEKIRNMYDDLRDLDYIVITGGTGEAWWPILSKELSGMKNLKVVPGNQNSDLPFTFSNVRGYYYFLYRTVKRRA